MVKLAAAIEGEARRVMKEDAFFTCFSDTRGPPDVSV